MSRNAAQIREAVCVCVCMLMCVIMCALCRIMRRESGLQSTVQITGLIALKRSNERDRGGTAFIVRQTLIYVSR